MLLHMFLTASSAQHCTLSVKHPLAILILILQCEHPKLIIIPKPKIESFPYFVDKVNQFLLFTSQIETS